MQFTRREAVALGAGTAAALALGLPALAQDEDKVAAAIEEFTGGADAPEGGVDITAPEIAENGNTVPIEVSGGDDVTDILVLADGNPNPGVATFHFTDLSGDRLASTRIRLAQTQNVIAVAKKADGSFAMATRPVKVTIGGCGG